MRDYGKLAHCRWECKYHLVFIPKDRKKVLYGKLRNQVGKVLRKLCEEKGVELLEGHAMTNHIHICLSIPPKFSVSEVVGYLKGKSAIRIHRECLGRHRNFTGYYFWARGYYVSTVGLDESRIRNYIRVQELQDRQVDQMKFPL